MGYPLLKDALGPQAVQQIADCLKAIYPQFDTRGFAQAANQGLNRLELKARVHHLIRVLNHFLPQDFEKTAQILGEIRTYQETSPSSYIRAFTAWPLIDYVAVYGLAHPSTSLATLAKLTALFSAEFAIRPFIQQHYELTYQHLQQWCDSPDYHIRRLVSEGTRPRLPWGARLCEFITDPGPIFPLLARLNNDSKDYVRRSVANNLNDISKDHPDRVLDTCRHWLNQPTAQKRWIVRHATRTLVKQGDPRVFALLGYDESPRLGVALKLTKQRVVVGEELPFTLHLSSKSEQPQKLLIDYAIHFMKKNGQPSNKMFRLKSLELSAAESVQLNKIHSFAPLSSRRYYPGKHRIEIKINGSSVAASSFTLEMG